MKLKWLYYIVHLYLDVPKVISTEALKEHNGEI